VLAELKQPFGLIAVYKFSIQSQQVYLQKYDITRTQNEPENGPDNGQTFHKIMRMHQILST